MQPVDCVDTYIGSPGGSLPDTQDTAALCKKMFDLLGGFATSATCFSTCYTTSTGNVYSMTPEMQVCARLSCNCSPHAAKQGAHSACCCRRCRRPQAVCDDIRAQGVAYGIGGGCNTMTCLSATLTAISGVASSPESCQ